MRGYWYRALLVVAVGLGLASARGQAQDLPSRSPPRPGAPGSLEPAVPAAPERSSFETLESLTSGRTEERERPEERDEIETDRDSFTPATVIAPRGRFILESAYSFIDNRGSPETHSFPETVLRYGLTERIELRLGWNAEIGGGGDVTGSDTGGENELTSRRVKREYTLSYGAKFQVT